MAEKYLATPNDYQLNKKQKYDGRLLFFGISIVVFWRFFFCVEMV